MHIMCIVHESNCNNCICNSRPRSLFSFAHVAAAHPPAALIAYFQLAFGEMLFDSLQCGSRRRSLFFCLLVLRMSLLPNHLLLSSPAFKDLLPLPCQPLLIRVGLGAPRRRSWPRAWRLGPKGAPPCLGASRLGSDPDLVPCGAAVPARLRPGWRCFVTCGFKQTKVFSY